MKQLSSQKMAYSLLLVRLSFFSKRKIWLLSGDDIFDKLFDIAKNITKFFTNINNKPLKNDHSSTVITIVSDEKLFVIRRDNFINIFSFVRRSFKKSKSRKVLEKGLFLKAEGLNTIKPLALIEDHIYLLRFRSFAIYEYIPGKTLRDYLSDKKISDSEKKDTAEKIVLSIKKWHSVGVTHGDPKAENILIQAGDIFFIDTEDIKTPKIFLTKRHAIARDICIVMHNWQEYQEIREIWTRKLLLDYTYGLKYFGKYLINKFWKDEIEVFSRKLSKRIEVSGIVKSILEKDVLENWKPLGDCEGSTSFYSKADSAFFSITPQSFFSNFWGGQFKKKRAPGKGILSMALSLEICGFHLPGIINFGTLDGYEYVFWNSRKGETVHDVWIAIKNDPLKKVHFLTEMAEEVGRLHAMGFIGVLMSVDSIFIAQEGDQFSVGFFLNGNIRRRQWGGTSCKKEIQMLNAEFLSRIPAPDASCFFNRYNEILEKA